VQSPLSGPEELSDAYAVEYAPYRAGWKQSGWPLWKILRELTIFRRMKRLSRYAKGNKLLEVGSGAGDFLYASHRAGWTVAAVEYSEELVNILRSELSLDVRSGELESGLWEPASFDVVALWNVIEHVPDPLETLRLVSSYLRPGGTVFLQFPTVDGISVGRRFRQNWELLDQPRHLHFLGRRSLSMLCDKAGLELTKYNTPLMDVVWCYLTSCSNLAGNSKSPTRRFLKLLALIPVGLLFLPKMAARAWRGCGTEAFAVAVKR
jgi:SAM-dependent methyltransferase